MTEGKTAHCRDLVAETIRNTINVEFGQARAAAALTLRAINALEWAVECAERGDKAGDIVGLVKVQRDLHLLAGQLRAERTAFLNRLLDPAYEGRTL